MTKKQENDRVAKKMIEAEQHVFESFCKMRPILKDGVLLLIAKKNMTLDGAIKAIIQARTLH